TYTSPWYDVRVDSIHESVLEKMLTDQLLTSAELQHLFSDVLAPMWAGPLPANNEWRPENCAAEGALGNGGSGGTLVSDPHIQTMHAASFDYIFENSDYSGRIDLRCDFPNARDQDQSRRRINEVQIQKQ